MKQPKHLRSLRKRLARLRRRRQRFRWATATSALAIAVFWALAGVFLLDWYFQRNVDLMQRLLLLGFAAAGVIWAITRFTLPWLGKREDVTEMALLVQRQAGIDSDLVAALQFESADAPRWGSAQLEAAVIDRVATQQQHVDVMAAMPRQPLARRLKLLIATLAVWGLLGVFWPDHLWVFFQRLAFGSQHYPSQTQVVAIKVNDKTVYDKDKGVDLSSPRPAPTSGFPPGAPAAMHVPCGQAVRFEVTVEGSQPASGRVEIAHRARGPAAIVPLEPVSGDGHPQADPLREYPARSLAQYRGEYAALNQSARYQVYLGDAWTDPFLLSVTPLPVVEIEAEVVLPVYARQSAHDVQKLARGMRQFAVLAGSEVRLRLDSDRPLKSAEVKLGERTYPMRRVDDSAKSAEVWTLATAGTPLASVAAELSYSIQVHDVEGQTLEKPPLEGSITIEPDQPPAIMARTKTPIVLPTGSPTIHYEAADDHALSRIWITWEATSGDVSGGTSDASSGASGTAEKREGRIDVCRFPPEVSPRNKEADYPLALSSLPLKPGDTLKVTFHVSDYRGPAAAATVDADPPLVYQVTDLHGFEASMYEADQKSAGVLEDIRRKHSGLGETQ